MTQAKLSMPRQAVVVIHGIGEQQPFNTLRDFVRGVVDDHHAVYGAPDDVLGRTYSRKLKVTWNHEGAEETLAIVTEFREANTDFFELYWAYRFRDTTMKHITSWLRPLLFARTRELGHPRLRFKSGFLARVGRWIVGLAVVATAALYLCLGVLDSLDARAVVAAVVGTVVVLLVSLSLGLIFLARTIAVLAAAAFIGFVVNGVHGAADGTSATVLTALIGTIVTPAISALLVGWLTSSLGDAARYLSNSPANVEENEAIRQAAVDLLVRLHEQRETTGRYRYNRIVVVGHSLGSVIGYDAIRHLWALRHRSLVLPPERSSDAWSIAIHHVESHCRVPVADFDRAKFRAHQFELYRLLRDAESTPSPVKPSDDRWIVSDLVTAGSPLTYAELLMAKGKKDLRRRFSERLLVRCPPVPQQSARAAMRPLRYQVGERSPSTRLHHAACFSAVRWTNLYFTHDLVGGQVGPSFGAGVEDTPLGHRRWLGWFLLSSPHSNYWLPPKRGPLHRRDEQGHERSLAVLRSIIERRPAVYLQLPDDVSLAALTETGLAIRKVAPEAAAGEKDIEVLGFTGRPRVGVWVPGCGSLRIDDLSVLSEITGASLAVSPDIRPGASHAEPVPEDADDEDDAGTGVEEETLRPTIQ